jgi:predicted SprT family Zn-dependent metalloprotease
MEILVSSRSKGKQAFVSSMVRLYEQELRLQQSKYKLEIHFRKGLKQEGMRGCVTKIGPKYLVMLLDSSLKDDILIETVAHEMVHVKQYAKGQIQSITGRKTNKWLGKHVKAKYYDRPWEIEAMSREKLLASKIYAIIS